MLAITPLFFILIPQPTRGATAEAGVAQRSLVDLREGLRFVWHWQGLTMMLIIATLSNLLAKPAFAIAPLLITAPFRGGALELSWVHSAFGVGVVAGGLTLGVWGGFKRRIVTTYLARVLSGVGFVVVGLAPANAFPLAVGAIFGVGFLNPIINGSSMALLQAIVPPEIQGASLCAYAQRYGGDDAAGAGDRRTICGCIGSAAMVPDCRHRHHGNGRGRAPCSGRHAD